MRAICYLCLYNGTSAETPDTETQVIFLGLEYFMIGIINTINDAERITSASRERTMEVSGLKPSWTMP